jgi:hypothetical protein
VNNDEHQDESRFHCGESREVEVGLALGWLPKICGTLLLGVGPQQPLAPDVNR